ncbi:hypothetical protein EDD18DRAFT_1112187 [Armillaria luteobubalina]|uniref:F-box domain-containing protein n=1 Tax=Armillaria luteobubalina TaxID=153913 RepID=A0AA39PH21_9AGAR|nr:hypothetical protein EDD18DRAFT_1112187 [Armillaria luteobubalina]
MACPACNADQNLDYYSGVTQTFSYLLPTSLETFILSNAPPSHDDCTLIKESLLSLTSKSVQLRNIIAEQDEAIAALSLVLDHYKDSHEEMLYEQSHVDDLIERHRRALSSPIRRVPVDIMREIFLLASFNAADVTDFAWIATHTCTEWRDIAKQMPILWSKIHVDMDIRTYTRPYYSIDMPGFELLHSSPRPTFDTECVPCALELSREVPLVISFIKISILNPKDLSEQEVELLDMLLDHASRWKVAYVDVSHSATLLWDKLQRLRGHVLMLESFSINTRSAPDVSTYPHDIISVAPRLCTISIVCSRVQLLFPWQQIQRLMLDRIYDMSYLLHILLSVKNTEHLTICNCGNSMDVNTSIIRLPTIHTLDLLSSSSLDSGLPSGMILPALEKLHVKAGRIEMSLNIKMHPITQSFMSKVGELLKSSGKCTILEDGPYFGERFVKTALSRKHGSLRVFEGSVRTKIDMKLLYKSILSATDKVSLEELKAEGMLVHEGFRVSHNEETLIVPSKKYDCYGTKPYLRETSDEMY